MNKHTETWETERGQVEVSVIDTVWNGRPIRLVRLPGWAHGDVAGDDSPN
jgi:hypothetical protein